MFKERLGWDVFFGEVEKPEAILGQISQFRFWTCSAIVEPLLNWKVQNPLKTPLEQPEWMTTPICYLPLTRN